MSYGLGVDLGTTFTSASVYADGQATAIPLSSERLAAPSAVFINGDGRVALGGDAATRGAGDPAGLVLHVKRTIGSNYPRIIRGTRYTPEQLLGVLLRWVLAEVEEATGEPPAHLTLTHPATWLDHRRARLAEVAAMVGFESNVGLQAEPDAAAVYHAGKSPVPAGAYLGVYDLGGGTFDATIIEKTADGLRLAGEPAGVDNLGGIDFDRLLREHVTSQIGHLAEGIDESDHATAEALHQLDLRVRDAKEALSSATSATIEVDLPSGVTEVRVTRDEFHSLVRPDLERTVDEFARALDQADVEADMLHQILLVGGSSRIPLVSELLSAAFGCPTTAEERPKLAVSLGAAITAGAIVGRAEGVFAEPSPLPTPEAPAAVPARVEKPKAHGTLHLSGNVPSVSLAVDLDRQHLAGKTDESFADVPLKPVVDPFPRHIWIEEEDDDQEDEGFRTTGSDNRPLIIVGILVAVVVVLLILLSLAG